MVLAPFNAGDIHYENDTQAIRDAAEGQGVLSGMAITSAASGLDISCSNGYGVDGLGSLETSSSETDVTLTAAHATLDRIDLIIWDASADTFAKIDGVASANPNPPDNATATDIILARCHVTAAMTTIADSDIYDLRAFIYGNQAVHTASDWKFNNSADIYLYSDYGSTQKVKIDGGTGDLTLAGDIEVGGDDIKDSGSNTVISFDGSGNIDNSLVLTVTGGTPAINVNTTGTAYIELDSSNGATQFDMDCVASNQNLIYFKEAGSVGSLLRYNTGPLLEFYMNGATYPDNLAMVIDGSYDTTFYGHVLTNTDGSSNLGASGTKWAIAYYDAADTSDPSSWNDVECLPMLLDSNMFKDRPKDSPYYISKITNTIQLDPSTLPFVMQDVYIHRTRYQKWLDTPEDEREEDPPNPNPDDPSYDPQEIGLLVHEMLTFNNKCLRELYFEFLELKKEVEKLKEDTN